MMMGRNVGRLWDQPQMVTERSNTKVSAGERIGLHTAYSTDRSLSECGFFIHVTTEFVAIPHICGQETQSKMHKT